MKIKFLYTSVYRAVYRCRRFCTIIVVIHIITPHLDPQNHTCTLLTSVIGHIDDQDRAAIRQPVTRSTTACSRPFPPNDYPQSAARANPSR